MSGNIADATPKTSPLLVRIGQTIGADGSGSEPYRSITLERGGARWVRSVIEEERPLCGNISEDVLISRLLKSKIYTNSDEAKRDLVANLREGLIIVISDGEGPGIAKTYALKRVENRKGQPEYEFSRKG